jgi:TetR/AcrR family transcriptional regulator, fatty acid metabolism regulator protein
MNCSDERVSIMNTKTAAKKARKKNVRKSREDRTTAILHAARKVFEERGYEAATIAEIAERVDVVEGTVLHYFTTKRALVIGLIEAFYADITSRLVEQIKGVRGARNQLYFVIWSHLSVLRENGALCAVILREARNLDPLLTQEVHDKNRLYTSVVKEIVAQGIQSGEIRPDASAPLIRNIIFGTTEHFFWDKLIGTANLDTKQLAAQLTQIIYEGIVAHHSAINTRGVNRLIGKLTDLLKERESGAAEARSAAEGVKIRERAAGGSHK